MPRRDPGFVKRHDLLLRRDDCRDVRGSGSRYGDELHLLDTIEKLDHVLLDR